MLLIETLPDKIIQERQHLISISRTMKPELLVSFTQLAMLTEEFGIKPWEIHEPRYQSFAITPLDVRVKTAGIHLHVLDLTDPKGAGQYEIYPVTNEGDVEWLKRSLPSDVILRDFIADHGLISIMSLDLSTKRVHPIIHYGYPEVLVGVGLLSFSHQSSEI